MQLWRYGGVDDERYGLEGFGNGSRWEGFQLSDDERSTRLTSVLRSEALKYTGWQVRYSTKRVRECMAMYKARCVVRDGEKGRSRGGRCKVVNIPEGRLRCLCGVFLG
jgi:hypothetical protein